MKSSNLNLNEVQQRIHNHAAMFGNKAANLIELDRLCAQTSNPIIKIHVPAIFPVDDHSIKLHLDLYAPRWRKLWDEFCKQQQNQKSSLTPASLKILQQLQDLIVRCFHDHLFTKTNTQSFPAGSLLMVRSTGEEDTAEIANPGGNKSIAAVKPDALSISQAMGEVVASYFSPKSLTQRLLSGGQITQQPFVPVLLQQMIGEKLNGSEHDKDIMISGVMYAFDHGITRIDAAPGQGELIVNGKALFDTFEITPANVVHAEVHRKQVRLVPVEIQDTQGKVKRTLVFKENSKKLQSAPALPPSIALAIAQVGRKIAEHYRMPMDIEFVYHPAIGKLAIVQARPVPQGKNQYLIPSAIAPEQWLTIKEDPTIEKITATVISPAGLEAKILQANNVIITSTIAAALRIFLNKSNTADISAIIVNNQAPKTSHEAAQFNALGIPVFKAPIDIVQHWLKAADACIIADTQRQCLVNLTAQFKNQPNKNSALRSLIQAGLFSSSLSTQKTLLPFYILPDASLAPTINKYLTQPKLKTDPQHIYTDLLKCLEILDTAHIGGTNQTAFNALSRIANVLKQIGTSTHSHDKNKPHQLLWMHGMLAIAEIDQCLQRISHSTATYQELFDLISKLRALITNPGSVNLYSDSLYQIAHSNKEASARSTATLLLSAAQQDYLNAFSKLDHLALNKTTQKIWQNFSVFCAKTKVRQQMLAQIIVFATENAVLSELINQYLVNQMSGEYKNANDINKKILVRLYQEIDNARSFTDVLKQQQRTISTWEEHIQEWAEPASFDRLYQNFNFELTPLIKKLSINNDMPDLTKQIVLKQVQRLAEVIDKSIKAMKSSLTYQSNKNLLVQRFYQMLEPYHALMNKWMRSLPANLYNYYAREVVRDRYNEKNSMLQSIEETFIAKQPDLNASAKIIEQQLHPSRYLAVASAKIGSTASFERQFVENIEYITLEDLFSLFHQNILASTVILGNNYGKIEPSQLPDAIKPLFNVLAEISEIDLLSIQHQPPLLTLEYNIPLNNHSAKLQLDFNLTDQTLNLGLHFFGRNWDNRMDLIGSIAEIEGLLLKAKLPFQPYYNRRGEALEIAWQFASQDIPHLSNSIYKILAHYCSMTENTDLTHYSKLCDRYFGPDANPAVLNKLSDAQCLLIGKKLQNVNENILSSLFRLMPELIERFLGVQNWDSATLTKYLTDILPSCSSYETSTLIKHFASKIDFNFSYNGDTFFLKLIQKKYFGRFSLSDIQKFMVNRNIAIQGKEVALQLAIENEACGLAQWLIENNVDVSQTMRKQIIEAAKTLDGQDILVCYLSHIDKQQMALPDLLDCLVALKKHTSISDITSTRQACQSALSDVIKQKYDEIYKIYTEYGYSYEKSKVANSIMNRTLELLPDEKLPLFNHITQYPFIMPKTDLTKIIQSIQQHYEHKHGFFTHSKKVKAKHIEEICAAASNHFKTETVDLSYFLHYKDVNLNVSLLEVLQKGRHGKSGPTVGAYRQLVAALNKYRKGLGDLVAKPKDDHTMLYQPSRLSP